MTQKASPGHGLRANTDHSRKSYCLGFSRQFCVLFILSLLVGGLGMLATENITTSIENEFPEDIKPSTRFSGGDGSPGNPFRISNVLELQWIGNVSNLGNNYRLINDIDATVTSNWDGGKGFKPLATLPQLFTGSLDGYGYKINNLFINRSTTNNVGFFGYITSGNVKNIELTDAYVVGKSNAGGLAGMNKGTISGCSFTGTVVGYGSNVGGLAGTNDGTLSNSYAAGSVSGGDYTGGFVGSNVGTISNCYSTATVEGSYIVGGFIGTSTSTVSNCYSTGSVNGNGDLGGFVAEDFSGVNNCFWDTETSGQSSSDNGTGKTTAQMKNLNTFQNVGWDFNNIWDIIDYSSYPFLRSIVYPGPDILINNLSIAVEDQAYEESCNAKSYLPGCTNLTWELDLCPNWLEITSEGVLIGTPSNDDVGDFSVVIRCMDFSPTNRSFDLLVQNTNDAPEINPLLETIAYQGSFYSVLLTATDVDPTGDILTWELVVGPDWLTLNATNTTMTTLEGIPSNTDIGNHNVTVYVKDNHDASDSYNFNLTVQNTNDPPHIETTPNLVAFEDELYSEQMSVYDEDIFDSHIWDMETEAGWLMIDAELGIINGTPQNQDVRDCFVMITVFDNNGSSDSIEFTLTIENTNDKPMITSIPITNAEVGIQYTYDVEAFDDDLLIPVGEVLTFSLDEYPEGMTINSTSGLIQWTPTDLAETNTTVIVNLTDDDEFVSQSFIIFVERTYSDEPIFNNNFTYFISKTDKNLVTFTANSVINEYGVNLIYKWNLGDGTAVLGQEVNHTYEKINISKDYIVTLTISDGRSDSGICFQTVTIEAFIEKPPIIADDDDVLPNGTDDDILPNGTDDDIDPELDTDGDGLPDKWEIDHFSNLNMGPFDDPDGDGVNNKDEFNGNSDPTDVTSKPAKKSDDAGLNSTTLIVIVLILILVILTIIIVPIIIITRGKKKKDSEDRGIESKPEEYSKTSGKAEPITAEVVSGDIFKDKELANRSASSKEEPKAAQDVESEPMAPPDVESEPPMPPPDVESESEKKLMDWDLNAMENDETVKLNLDESFKLTSNVDPYAVPVPNRDSASKAPILALPPAQIFDEPAADHPRIDEIFVITKDGMLIKHYSYKETSLVDEDILASMLTVVQTFITDSFSKKQTALKRLELGDFSILITPGDFLNVVIISPDKQIDKVEPETQAMLVEVETLNASVLDNWDGDESGIKGLDESVHKFVKAEYI